MAGKRTLKKFHHFKLVIIGCSLLINPAYGIELNTNLLDNGDFSKELSSWTTKQPTRLTHSGLNDSLGLLVTVDRDTEGLREHSNNVATNCVNVDDGDNFSFSANVRYLNKPIERISQRAFLVWFQDLNCRGAAQISHLIDPEVVDGWQHLSRTNVRPPIGSKSMHVRLLQISSRAKVSVDSSDQSREVDSLNHSLFVSAIWDNIELIATSRLESSQELVIEDKSVIENSISLNENYFKEGGFDTDPDEIDFRNKAYWVNYVGRNAEGSMHATLLSDGEALGYRAFRRCVNVAPHSVFDVGISYKRDVLSSQVGSAKLSPRWFEGPNCNGRYISAFSYAYTDDNSGTWQDLTIEGIRRPESATSLSISVTTFMRGSGQYSTYWDDMYLYARE